MPVTILIVLTGYFLARALERPDAPGPEWRVWVRRLPRRRADIFQPGSTSSAQRLLPGHCRMEAARPGLCGAPGLCIIACDPGVVMFGLRRRARGSA